MKPGVQTSEPQAARTGRVLEALVDFCRAEGAGTCYQGWPRELLREYLIWHLQQGSAAYVLAEEGESGGGETEGEGRRTPNALRGITVLGVGVAWPCDERRIREAHAAGEHVCDYEPADRDGDAVFLGDFIGTERGVLGALVCHLQQRWQGTWEGKKWFTYRKGKLVQVNERILKKKL